MNPFPANPPRRRSTLVRALVVLLAIVPHSVFAQERTTVSAASAPVRKTPVSSDSVFATLPKGTAVTVRERTGSWARVFAATTVGWVPANTLAAVSSRSQTTASTSAKPDAGKGSAKPPVPAPVSEAISKAEATPVSTGQSRMSDPPARPAPAPVSAVAPAAAANGSVGAPRANRDPAGATGVSLGLLGSVTQFDKTASAAAQNHIAALPLLLIQNRFVGLYAAPEIGTGAGYRSVMLGGGVTLRLISVGRLQVRGLGGYTTYTEEPASSGTNATFTKRSTQGVSVGGLASLRLFGAVRLGYRGQYVIGTGDQSSVRFQRHSFGLIF